MALRHHRDFLIKDNSGLPLCSKTLQVADLSDYQNNLRAATWFVPCAAENSVRPALAWSSVGLPRPGESLARWDCKERLEQSKGGDQLPSTSGTGTATHKGKPHTAPVTQKVTRTPDTQIQTQFHTRTENAYFTIVCKVPLCKVNKAMVYGHHSLFQ